MSAIRTYDTRRKVHLAQNFALVNAMRSGTLQDRRRFHNHQLFLYALTSLEGAWCCTSFAAAFC